jgi:hypothetical protein
MSPRNGQISKIVQNRISALRSKNLEQGNLLSQKVSPKTRFFLASSLAGAHLNSVFWLLTTGLAWALLNWNFPMQARALGKFPTGGLWGWAQVAAREGRRRRRREGGGL